MRSLTAVSQRSLRRRKGRYALTALGIALGVGIVFAVVLTSGATSRALDRFVSGFTGDADVVVHPSGTFDSGLDPRAVEAVERDPDVERTVERFMFRSSFELRGEDIDFRDYIDVHGFDFDQASAVHNFVLARGRLPEPGRKEVLITPVIESRVGDDVTLATAKGRQRVRIVGELADEGAAIANGGRVVYTTIETARAIQDAPGQVSQLDLVLGDGVDTGEWVDAHSGRLPGGAVVRDAADLASGFRDFLASVQGALTIVAAIALFVGAFLIFLTFSVAVAERTRFYGTIRALGAQPGQVRRLVLGEAVLLGVVASLAGLGVGYALSLLSLGLVNSLIDVGSVTLEDPWGPAIMAVALGTGVSFVSSLIPARRAASLSPVAAMRDEAVDGHDRIRVVPRAALLVVGVTLTLVSGSILVQAFGLLLIMLGAVLLTPAVLRPLARVLGRITARAGRGVGDVAVMHLVKERSRSAYTLALVMVVLAAIIAIGSSNASMANSLDEVVDRQFGSDLVVSAPNTFSADFEDRLRAVDGIRSVSETRVGFVEILEGDGSSFGQEFLLIIDPETYFDVSSFPWADGGDRDARGRLARGGQVLLSEPQAEDLGVEVGGRVRVQTLKGARDFTLAGTFTVLGFNDALVVNLDDGARYFGADEPMGYLIDVEPGVAVEGVRRTLKDTLGGRYDFELESAEDVKAFARSQLQGFFGIGYAVLLVAVIIGILGLANTLIVSVIQRTREIGVLRSTGVLRGQLRAMVLAEAATLMLAAWVLSLPLGFILTRVAVQVFGASLGFTVDFYWPWGLLPFLLLLALVAGVVASLGPARRAARLDPVVALRFD
ncbi:MAG: ABC transporter permease [Actinobacteria bacterium]|nr:ABC transporter permease [Actinomycetota bacterium]